VHKLQGESSVLRLFGILVLVLTGTGGVMLIDFNRLVQEAAAAEAKPPSFRDYLDSVPEKLASLTAPSRSSSLSLASGDMLPPAPEGWTARPLADGNGGDIDSFLPRAGNDGDGAGIERVKAAASTRVEAGGTVAIQAYERGERLVVIQIVRLPDSIFVNPDAADRRYEAQVQAAELRGRPFLSVRGLDVTEEFLGDGLRARYFTASVGAQIQIRVLASRRLKDSDLVPFFETLPVQAMNAAVVDRQPGLGEIPVLVLAAALDEDDRAAFEADRAARAADAIARAREARDLAKAELAAKSEAAPPENAPPATTECKTSAGGIKRCSISTGG
jgi:hypothetical protein